MILQQAMTSTSMIWLTHHSHSVAIYCGCIASDASQRDRSSQYSCAVFIGLIFRLSNIICR